MTYTKVTVIILAVLAFFSALIAIVSLGLMSAEDYAVQEQVAYTSFKEPENYDPEIFAYDANRGELRKEYFGIKLADLKQDENGNFIMSEQQRETFIKNILGKHMCSLQWISWKDFGTVTISQDSDKTIHVKGGQKSKTNSDYLEIDGTLTVVNPLHLQFTGEIITCVDHINNGNPVKRNGTYNFTVAGQRRYWRMQEMTNPDDPCCDYVDIYFD
jgi:hypothetical protein